MITIILLGGPEDGREISIPDDVWKRGTVVITTPTNMRREIPTSEFKFKRLTYTRKRWIPNWSCFVPTSDGILPFIACQPIHKWTFDGYKW